MKTTKLSVTMFFMAIATLWFTSCDNQSKKNDESAQADSLAAQNAAAAEEPEEEEPLAFETLVEQTQGKGDAVTISVQYPVSGPEVLVNAIREYINESFGGNYSGNLTDLENGRDMVKFYYNQRMADLKDYASDEPHDASIGYSSQTDSIYLKCQTDEFITFMHYSEFFYAGAAHPGSSQAGVTFRRSDGRRMDWSLFTGQYDKGFQRLIKGGLMHYFEVDTEEELYENLQLGSEYGANIPLPNSCPPLFTPRGVRFIYAEYEIASYAAGMPHFTIPYEDIEPFMGPVAKNLIPNRGKSEAKESKKP